MLLTASIELAPLYGGLSTDQLLTVELQSCVWFHERIFLNCNVYMVCRPSTQALWLGLRQML